MAFLLFEDERTGVESWGRPNTKPVAATPTVLDATNYDYNVSTEAREFWVDSKKLRARGLDIVVHARPSSLQ